MDDDPLFRARLHENEVLHREAVQFHGQLQRVTQFTLVVTVVAAPLVYGLTDAPARGLTDPAAGLLLFLGAVYFVLSLTFVAYFRALVVNMAYRRRIEARVNAMFVGRDALGYRTFVEDWYPQGSTSNRVLMASWGVQFLFPLALGVLCVGAVVFAPWSRASVPFLAAGLALDVVVLGVVGYSFFAFREFKRKREEEGRRVATLETESGAGQGVRGRP